MNKMPFEVGTIDTMPTEKHDYSENGECSNCGACCSNLLPMSPGDIKRIRRYIKKHRIKPALHGIPMDATVDWLCPFMDPGKEHKCRIYPARPEICRMFFCGKRPTEEEAMRMTDWTPVNVRREFFKGGGTP